MASRCEVRLHAPDESMATAWAEAAIAEVRRIEAKYSRYRDDSVTSAINRAAGREAVRVDDETAHLIDFGAALYVQSKGRFDLTSGVLRRVWDFKARRVPEQSALDAVLPLIGWHQVAWRDHTIALPRAGMEIDFGGIGKEYAADRAGAALVEHGGRCGFVNLGGDVRVIGPAPDRTPWRIAIQDPRGAAGEILAHLDVASGGLATSGDYERYFVADGRRYCHILDPRTGWPVTLLAVGVGRRTADGGRRGVRHDCNAARRRVRARVPARPGRALPRSRCHGAAPRGVSVATALAQQWARQRAQLRLSRARASREDSAQPGATARNWPPRVRLQSNRSAVSKHSEIRRVSMGATGARQSGHFADL